MPFGDGIGNDPGNSLGNDPGSGISQNSTPIGFPSARPTHNKCGEYGIDWGQLHMRLTRLRPIYTETSRGNQTINFAIYPSQEFRGLIQPRIRVMSHTLLESEQQGVVQIITYVLYANFVVNHIPNAAPTDIKFLDRIVDYSTGLVYRVEAPLDAAGQMHHLEIPLIAISPDGD